MTSCMVLSGPCLLSWGGFCQEQQFRGSVVPPPMLALPLFSLQAASGCPSTFLCVLPLEVPGPSPAPSPAHPHHSSPFPDSPDSLPDLSRFLQEGDHRWINTIARALQLLNSLYGPFGRAYGIGRCAKVWLRCRAGELPQSLGCGWGELNPTSCVVSASLWGWHRTDAPSPAACGTRQFMGALPSSRQCHVC